MKISDFKGIFKKSMLTIISVENNMETIIR